MIAGFNYGRQLTLENCYRSAQPRNFVRAQVPIRALKAAFFLTGEQHRNFALRFSQHIHGEVSACAEVLQKRTAMIDADENQGRFDGYGRKRANRQPVRRTIRSANRGHGNAGREQSARVSEDFSIQSARATGMGVNGCS